MVRSRSKAGSTVVALAFWLDLRGYGAMLNNAGFDPTHREAKAAIERLRRFQEVVARHSQNSFPTLVINDGAVAYRDIGFTVANRAFPFIQRCWDLYQSATEADQQLGGIGLRGVLAAGLRAKGSNRGILAENEAMTNIIKHLVNGRISEAEAISAACKVRRVHDIVPQLQANFAFARAYTADQGAREGKLTGSRFYLDMRILREGIPGWMAAGEPTHWEPQVESLSALATTFVEVQTISDARDREQAIRTGRELRPYLSSS